MNSLHKSSSSVSTRGVSGLLAFAFLALLGTTLLIWSSNNRHLLELRDVIEQNQVASRKMELFIALIEAARTRTRLTAEILYIEDPFLRDEINLRLERQANRFAAIRSELMTLPLSNEEKAVLAQQATIVPRILPAQRRAVELAIHGDDEALVLARKLLHEEVVPGQGELIDLFLQLINLEQTHIEVLTAASDSTYQEARNTGLVLVGAAVAFGILLSTLVVVRVRHVQQALTDSHEQLEHAVASRTEELAKAQSMLRKVLDTIPVRVFWKDSSGRYLGCNRLFAEDAGLVEASEIRHKRDHELRWSNRAALHEAEDQAVIESGTEKLECEELRTAVDGSQTWWSASKVPLSDADGGVAGMLGTYHEITERKNAEQALKSNEMMLRTVVDSMVDGLLTISQDGIVQSINPSAQGIFGYQSEEVVGRPMSLLVPRFRGEDGLDDLRSQLDPARSTILGTEQEMTGRRRDDTDFPMELAIKDMRVGDTLMYTCIVRDITERKRIEKMKDEFVSTVSHELRTPLTSIRGSLGLILGGAIGKVSEQATDMLNLANRNTDRLLALINDILDMQKIESGEMDYELDTLHLPTLAQRAIEEHSVYATQYGVEFRLTEQEDAYVMADENRLMQVMGNLLSNAAKFSDPGNRVEISVRSTGDKASLSVRDYGRGIPQRFHERLFQRFTQVDSSDSRQKGGTGLGLTISKSIIEQHGGSISFETAIDEGTTFIFELPLAAHQGSERAS